MDMCENLDDEMMAVLEKKLMGKHPNTYTLTKSLAEQVILTKGVGLPAVAIVRPSIVCAAIQDPYPGWVDNVCGITGDSSYWKTSPSAYGALRSRPASLGAGGW
jgi:fatty acyl-CoA reductase